MIKHNYRISKESSCIKLLRFYYCGVFCGGLRYVSDIMVHKYHEDVGDEDPLEFQGKS